MVVSRIDKSITYPDVKAVDEGDLGLLASIYQIELAPGLEGTIALGNVRFTFLDKEILYIPVYLVEGDNVEDQIGVYEFLSASYPDLLDADNDFAISKLTNPLPLYYSYVTNAYLKDKLGKRTTGTAADKPAGKTDEEDDVIVVSDDDSDAGSETDNGETDELSPTVPNSPTVLEQLLGEEDTDDDEGVEKGDTRLEEIQERNRFDAKKAANWLQLFMRNTNYGIVDNEGRGDCLFAVIRDAYKGIGVDISVAQLREKLSERVTEDVYRNFKEQYTMYATVIPQSRLDVARLSSNIKKLEKSAKRQRDRNLKYVLIEQAREYVVERRRVRREKKHAEALLREFSFMKDVNSVEELKQKVRSCDFWANAWAINTLERILNIKLVILSVVNYRAGDIENVLQCGTAVDADIEKKGVFKPKYYIMTEYNGGHYKLITYKNITIFRFNQIPYSIKELIRTKCMERGDGIWNYIPKFKNFGKIITTDEGAEDIGQKSKEAKDEGIDKAADVKYDDTTVFQFYSRSKNALPGKGAGEKIQPENAMKFADLAAIPNWRQHLSNFSVFPFELDGHRWKTVEHYYHANKFKQGNPDFYLKFSLDSGSELSEDPGMAKAAGGKTGKYKGKQFRPKTVTIDKDFFSSGRNQKTMLDGQYAKYSQNPAAKALLLATKDAKLQHFSRGQPPIVFYDTMIVRKRLQN